MGNNRKKKSLTKNKDHVKQTTVNVNVNHFNKNENNNKEKDQLVRKPFIIDNLGKTIKVHKDDTPINELAIKKVKKRKLRTSEFLTREHSNEVTDENRLAASSNDFSANMEVEAKKSDESSKLETKKEKKRKLQMSKSLASEETKEKIDEKGSDPVSCEHYSTRIDIKAKNRDDKYKSRKEKKRKHDMTEDQPNEHSNKLVVDNENSLEIPVTSRLVTSVEASTKNKGHLNKNEATVKDEDIDKFCDEIDEEDNQQYENWIQLLEAKLHPNKSKK